MTAQIDRVALVTGAARGIGRATALRLARDGYAVAVNDRDAGPELDAVVAQAGERAIALPADVADEAAVTQMVAAAVERFGALHVLVNNAGLTEVACPLDALDQAAFERVLAVNLTGAFLCARAAVPHMRAAGWGRIVNVGSVLFHVGDPRFAHYVASKGGVVGLTRALARELGADAITVNTVSPGAIETERVREAYPDRAAYEREVFRLQSLRRCGVPEDVAAAVAFLASDDASFVTGQTLAVDGGWAML